MMETKFNIQWLNCFSKHILEAVSQQDQKPFYACMQMVYDLFSADHLRIFIQKDGKYEIEFNLKPHVNQIILPAQISLDYPVHVNDGTNDILTIPIHLALQRHGIIVIDSKKKLEIEDPITKYMVIGDLVSSYLLCHQQLKNIDDIQHQFMINMSHEIRTPLSSVFHALYLLASSNLTNEQKDFLDMGQSSLDHLSSIIEDILDMTTIESGQLEINADTFNIEDEMIRVMHTMKKQVEQKNLSLGFRFDNDIHTELIGDYRKIRQILLHVIDNSIKYSHTGTITLDVKWAEVDQKQGCIFQVSDMGIGMDQETIDQLSHAFYQVE